MTTATFSPYHGLDKPIPIPAPSSGFCRANGPVEKHRSWCADHNDCLACFSATVVLPLPSIRPDGVAEMTAEIDADTDEPRVWLILPMPDVEDAYHCYMVPRVALDQGLSLIAQALAGPERVVFDLSAVTTDCTATVQVSTSDTFALASALIETAFLATQD